MDKKPMMATKASKLFRKWSCFGNRNRRDAFVDQPRITVTECPSPTSPPSSPSSRSSSSLDEDLEVDIYIRTQGKIHAMGMKIAPRYRTCHYRPSDSNHTMVCVTDIELGLFAHGFGLREGDVLHKVNDTKCVGARETKNVFSCYNSAELRLEIIRKVKNPKTGKTELKKIVISNSLEGHSTVVLETIMTVEVESSWSLSGPETFFPLAQQPAYLQFNCCDYPTLVYNDSRGLVLNYSLSQEERDSQASFLVRKYFSVSESDTAAVTVILQHTHSGRCVAVVNESIIMTEPPNVDDITREHSAFLFRMHVPEGLQGSNKTFKSFVQGSDGKAIYLGFKTNGRTAEGSAIAVHVSEQQANGRILQALHANEVVFTLIEK